MPTRNTFVSKGRAIEMIVAALFTATLLSAAAADDISDPGWSRYVADCSRCHGRDAKGDGPEAATLVASPTDLTTLSRGNGGAFPDEYVRRVIDGRELSPVGHGEASMPVWGNHYRRALPGYSEAVVQEKIDALLDYLNSIQVE